MQTVLNSYVEALPDTGAAPEWVHLLPAGTFTGADGRGPFELSDPAELIAASMKPGRKLPIDVNHAIDFIGKDGNASPAFGWIVNLENRADGIWGRVDWTAKGRQALADKDYGYLSPVFTHPKTGTKRVTQLLRAALTNDPNLTLTALHHRKHQEGQSETTEGELLMEKQMREALGLPETATSEEVLKAAKEKVAQLKTATEQMSRIAQAAGLKAGASETEIVTALNARGQSGDDKEKAELRAEITSLNTRLTEVVTNAARTNAEATIQRAMDEGKIVPALRDTFIARHIKDPAAVDAEIKLMPSINAGGLRRRTDDPSAPLLTDEEAEIAELMGIDPKKMAETSAQLKKERM